MTEDDEASARRPACWSAFERAVAARHGVADTALATAHDIPRQRYHRRTEVEGWPRPRPGLRLLPGSNPSVQQRLVVVTTGTDGAAAASRDVAAWLHGLGDRPPEHLSVAIAHGCTAVRYRDVHVHRARWLTPDEVVEVDGVPTLSVPAMLLSSARAPVDRQRARLIDVLHRRLTDPDEVAELLERVGPVPGKGTLRALVAELGPLAVESVFQDDVATTLLSLGYPVERSVTRIETPDGRGLTVDVALLPWQVALETDGDAFHRTREQRRRDRRRLAAYAGTDWVPVPIDWRDWVEDRGHVLATIDAAVEAQRRRGLGPERVPPRR